MTGFNAKPVIDDRSRNRGSGRHRGGATNTYRQREDVREDEMLSSYDYLLPPSVERRVIRVRRHWAALLRALLQTVCILTAVFLLSWLVRAMGEGFWLVSSLLWYVAGVAVVRFSWNVLRWWKEIFIVTDKRLVLSRGVVEKTLLMVPITKVTNISVLLSEPGQLLDYGTLKIESDGEMKGLNSLEYVPKPGELFVAFSELVFGENR
ncbi:MAG: PH domain-containing protein [Pseudonocardiaceae bacterium]